MNHLKITVTLTILFFSSFFGFSQSNENSLKGSNILYGSDRNVSACIIHGLCFDSLYVAECKTEISETPPPTKINSIRLLNDSILKIEFQTFVDCSHDFLCEIAVHNDTLLSLEYISYGGIASCMCSFKISYFINIDKNKIADIETIMIKDFEFTKTKFNLKNK